jgi:hypothetical protein
MRSQREGDAYPSCRSHIGTDRNVEATMFDALLHAFVAIPAQALQLTEIERVHIAFVPLDDPCLLPKPFRKRRNCHRHQQRQFDANSMRRFALGQSDGQKK